MTHANSYPGKTFVPYEGDMPVRTIYMPNDYRADREGIAGVSPEKRAIIGNPEDSDQRTFPSADPTGENVLQSGLDRISAAEALAQLGLGPEVD